MMRRFKILRSTTFPVVAGLSRFALGITIVGMAFIGFTLLVLPAIAAFLTMEWARARRWFAAR